MALYQNIRLREYSTARNANIAFAEIRLNLSPFLDCMRKEPSRKKIGSYQHEQGNKAAFPMSTPQTGNKPNTQNNAH